MLGVERLGWTVVGDGFHQFMPPMIASGPHADRRTGALVNNHLLH